ncbi:hypothetical protein B5M42_012435 [Paenibacillus athensensis]|uniref:hypothetical protein n=1 Tax=Paenibacillus athensensis TaxID=1967502 RepID=UPI0014309CD0|nr:hypothetical protein [Paenibacillus athensensis]MCD1259640.1 hypothetical protein [Paenibacillus athensensis]
MAEYVINCITAVVAALIDDKLKASLLGRRIAKILLSAFMLLGVIVVSIVLIWLQS